MRSTLLFKTTSAIIKKKRLLRGARALTGKCLNVTGSDAFGLGPGRKSGQVCLQGFEALALARGPVDGVSERYVTY
jgi:hypothetical protein